MATALLLLWAAAAPAREPLPYPPESRWASLPRLVLKPEFKPSTAWIEKARALEQSGTCTFAKDAGTTRVQVPFILLLSPKGAVLDTRVADTGCAELEAYVAKVVGRFGPRQIVPPRGTPPLWRASRFVAGWRD